MLGHRTPSDLAVKGSFGAEVLVAGPRAAPRLARLMMQTITPVDVADEELVLGEVP
jgi:hypothetical protein